MRSMKKLSVLVAVFAFCAIGAANASAAQFTSTVGGPLVVTKNDPQVFVTPQGTVTCTGVKVTGTAALATTSQHATVNYSGCKTVTGPFTFTTHITPVTYLFTAGDTGGAINVHILNEITITPTGAGCTIGVLPQTVGTVDYSSSGGQITLAPNVTKITSRGSTQFCDSTLHHTGTYTGNITIGVKGGSLAYDH